MSANTLMSRRHMIGIGIAMGTMLAHLPLATPALAKAPKDWVLPEEYQPAIIRIKGKFEPGEIHVDPNRFMLFLTLPDRKAIRYMVGVAKGDLYIPGNFKVGAKKEWPSWTPTAEMIARSPSHYAQFKDGMPGGPTNPLGARALYLFDDVLGDTFLRIHGTPEPWTIGTAVSNGCVRLVNSHVEHLYEQVEIGAPIFLYPKKKAAA